MKKRLQDLGEFGFIRHITGNIPQHDQVLQSVGDDCAVVKVGEKTLVISCDAAVEQVHFDFSLATPGDIGWRVATAALSDIAAMGAAPLFVTVALAMPPNTPLERAEGLYAGIAESVREHGGVIIGGDTTSSPSHIFVDLTVIGEATAGPLLRSGAREGDLLAVTGYPGRSGGGLLALQLGLSAPELIAAHLRPQARLREGAWLAQQEGVRAMMDVSDGVLQDAGHLCESSGVGADIDPAKLPVSEALRQHHQHLAAAPESLILSGGEDYELLMALEPALAPGICAQFESKFHLPLTVIGCFTGAWQEARVSGEVVERGGYDHFLS